MTALGRVFVVAPGDGRMSLVCGHVVSPCATTLEKLDVLLTRGGSGGSIPAEVRSLATSQTPLCPPFLRGEGCDALLLS